MPQELDVVIRESLLEFAQEVARTGWRGREREAVSLYALGHLLPRCHPGAPLHHPTQIGLEVAVGQPPGPSRKPQVCKDLVIWPEPAMVCWDESGRPTHQSLAILEWKVRTSEVSVSDESWLCEYSKSALHFTGFAIALNPQGDSTTLVASRVAGGLLTRNWLRYSAAQESG